MLNMRSNKSFSVNSTAPANGSPPQLLNALLVYEDVTVALRGQEVLRSLARELKPQFELHSSLWKFDLLPYPELVEQATLEALEADVIIIAAHGETDLSPHVTGWIESWLPGKRGRQAALIALLGRGDEVVGELGQPRPVREYLREAAQNGGMDFFCNLGDLRQPCFHQYAPDNTDQRRPRATSPSIAEIYNDRSIQPNPAAA